MAVNLNRDGPLKLWLVTRERLAQLAIKLGITRLPNFVPRFDARKIDSVSDERERYFVSRREHLENTSALLLLIWSARIEHHAIACFQRRFQPEDNTIAFHSRDFA